MKGYRIRGHYAQEIQMAKSQKLHAAIRRGEIAWENAERMEEAVALLLCDPSALLRIPFPHVRPSLPWIPTRRPPLKAIKRRAIWCALKFGLLPWRSYEKECHYKGMGYRAHLAMNLRYALSWLRGRYDSMDVRFELETNWVRLWECTQVVPRFVKRGVA